MHWGSAARGPPLGHCSAFLSQYYRCMNGEGEIDDDIRDSIHRVY
jgi:hypothetical protein